MVCPKWLLEPLGERVLRPAIANVITACGIVTYLCPFCLFCFFCHCKCDYRLRYCDGRDLVLSAKTCARIANVITACGIVTFPQVLATKNSCYIANVITACGIVTNNLFVLRLIVFDCKCDYRLRYCDQSPEPRWRRSARTGLQM